MDGLMLDSELKQHSRTRTNMTKAKGFSRRQFVASACSTAALAVLPVYSPASTEIPTTKGDRMTTLTPYLLFDGACHDAMEFYQSVFGGELTATKVKDSPAKDHMPAFQQNKTLNARLRSGAVEISASDWLARDQTPIRGNTVCLFLSGGTFQELKTLFEKLAEEAEVTDPLKKQFFGVYGALNDKFGVRWMFQTNSQD
jgi:PhnB protein